MADYIFLLETRLSQEQQAAIQVLQTVTRDAGLNLYLTGGPMRDLLTARPVRYLDFTTEGNPVSMAKALSGAGAERISTHAGQRTLNFSLRGHRVRIRAARAEQGSGSGTIVEDLRGRGLTVNSIGLSLNLGSRGLLIDPTNGIADIEARLIRMNQPYVFLDDPIYLLRAVRLRHRLEFGVEERTFLRMESAREGQYLAKVSPESLGQELEGIAYEPDPAAALKAMDKDGWLEPAFGKQFKPAKMNLGGLAQLAGAIEQWEQLGVIVDAGLAAMPFLLGQLPASEQTRLGKMLPSRHLGEEWKKIAADAAAFQKRITQRGVTSALQVQEIVEKSSPEGMVLASLKPQDAKSSKAIKEFLAHARQLRQRLPLGVLRAHNVAPGSDVAERVLRPLYRRMLGGEAISDAELAEIVRQQVAPPAPEKPAKPAGKGKAAAGKPSTVSETPVKAPVKPPAVAAVKPTAPVAAPITAAPAVSKPLPKAAPQVRSKPATVQLKARPAVKKKPAKGTKARIKSAVVRKTAPKAALRRGPKHRGR